MNVNESTQKLQEAIFDCVDDYARDQAESDWPEQPDDAFQYASDISDDPRIFKALDKLVESIMYKEYEKRLNHHFGEINGEKDREATHESMRTI